MARHEFPDHPGFELERWMLSRVAYFKVPATTNDNLHMCLFSQ